MRTLLTLLTLLTLVPLPTHAYVVPEDMLESGDFFTAPPNARGAKAARAAQEAEYDARKAEDEAAEAEHLSNTIDDLHGAAPTDEVIDWIPDGSTLTPEERRDARVLDRVKRTRLEGKNDNGEILRGSAPTEPMHGGAPLAPTGMGTVVLLLSGAAAIGYTLRKALQSI